MWNLLIKVSFFQEIDPSKDEDFKDLITANDLDEK